MPLITYTRDIPFRTHKPSADQPVMQTNTNSVDDIIDVDHFSFNEMDGGLHRQVNLVVEATPPLLGDVTIYAKASGGKDVPWVNNGTDLPLISGTPTLAGNGKTSLYGGVILQWGSFPTGASPVTVNFTTPFATLYTVVASLEQAPSLNNGFIITSKSNAGFTAIFFPIVASTINWIAIGV